jgi:hypothetical protein
MAVVSKSKNTVYIEIDQCVDVSVGENIPVDNIMPNIDTEDLLEELQNRARVTRVEFDYSLFAEKYHLGQFDLKSLRHHIGEAEFDRTVRRVQNGME